MELAEWTALSSSTPGQGPWSSPEVGLFPTGPKCSGAASAVRGHTSPHPAGSVSSSAADRRLCRASIGSDSGTTCARQLVHRAREHVQARRPRFPADSGLARRAAERFLAAALGGDLGDLLEVLAPDTVLWTDGGGAVRAALRPVTGAAKVARLLATIGPRYGHLFARWLPGNQPTALLLADGELRAVLVLELDADTARVRNVYGVVNPGKLTHLSPAR